MFFFSHYISLAHLMLFPPSLDDKLEGEKIGAISISLSVCEYVLCSMYITQKYELLNCNSWEREKKTKKIVETICKEKGWDRVSNYKRMFACVLRAFTVWT